MRNRVAKRRTSAPQPSSRARGKDEYLVWGKLKAGSCELPMVLVFPPDPMAWALDTLEALRGKRLIVANPRVKWAPPWTKEWESLLRRQRKTGERPPEDYWTEEIQFIRGVSYEIPRKWLRRRFDRGEMEIAICDWLPAVCSCCSLVPPPPEGRAYYRISELATLEATARTLTDLCCPWRWQGHIGIDQRATACEAAFRFLLAHELVHAINKLTYAAPAIMNKRGFLRNVLGVGAAVPVFGEDLPDESRGRDGILDVRGRRLQSSELEYLGVFFGKRIRAWYRGFVRWDMALGNP